MSAPLNENKMSPVMKRVADEDPSGAKAPDLSGAVSARLKSCPDTSCTCDDASQADTERMKSCPDTSCTCGNVSQAVNAERVNTEPMTLEQVRRELKGA